MCTLQQAIWLQADAGVPILWLCMLCMGAPPMQCTRSATILLGRQPEHPSFESMVEQSRQLFTNYHSKMVANVVLHVSTLWGIV